MKKLMIILLCIALTFGLFAGCGRKIDEMESPAGIAGGTEATDQTEPTQQTDATQGTNATEGTDATQGTEPPQEPKPPKEPEPEEALEPLDISVYKEGVLFKSYSAFRLGEDASNFYNLSGNVDWCYQEYILEKLPTTAYRYITPDHAYAIYESDTGCRVYLFFDYVMIANNPVRKGYPIVIKDMLSYSDFVGLKVGDSINAVEEVDSVTSYYKEAYKSYNMIAAENLAKGGDPIRTLHYLKDGILRINYSMPEEGKLVISEIIYNEDYCLTDKLNRSVSHKIKAIDLPTT